MNETAAKLSNVWPSIAAWLVLIISVAGVMLAAGITGHRAREAARRASRLLAERDGEIERLRRQLGAAEFRFADVRQRLERLAALLEHIQRSQSAGVLSLDEAGRLLEER